MDKEIFTSVIRVKGSAKYNVVSVKSSEPVEYDKWIELSKIITVFIPLLYTMSTRPVMPECIKVESPITATE